MKKVGQILFMVLIPLMAQSQIGNQIKSQIIQRKNNKINNAINQGLDKVENKLDSTLRKGNKSGTNQGVDQGEESETESVQSVEGQSETERPKPVATTVSPEKAYAKFDFVPGNKVILEDNFVAETSDEIPSLWVPTSGQVEVAQISGQNVMGFIEEGIVYPRHSDMSLNSTRTTLEFDYLFRKIGQTWAQAMETGNYGNEYLVIQFARDEEYYSTDYQANVLGDFSKRITIYADGTVRFGSMEGKYSQGQMLTSAYGKYYADLADKWVHVSVAITEKSIKVYLNSQRVINSVITKGHAPTFQFTCADCSSRDNGHQLFVKNVRIAEGGADPYKQLTSSGRFIARGITFDVAKATIRPESFGALNEVVALMNNDATLKFEIGGHTDSDGDDASNLQLSQQRADAVKGQLVTMGIDATRLTTKGYGESKPLVTNDSPENKANNRRVEFVKN
jgi:flagellar motor protein MotB